MNDRHVSAEAALSAFFRAVKDEAMVSPAFRARLIDALGVNVLYEGEEQFEGANPIKQAGLWSEDAFLRIWSKASMKQIRDVLKSYQLATPEDMKGKKRPQLVAMLYDRAQQVHDNDGMI